MRTTGLIATALILTFALPLPAGAQVTALTGATIIDGNGGAPVADGVIVITDKKNVVHIYTFTTNMDEYMKYEKPIAKAAFGETPPASTLVEVRRLVDPDWMVEVQVDAVSD